MTTDTQKASEAEKDEEQSILPTVLAGLGILAVAALLIFWPSGDESSADNSSAQNGANAADGSSQAGGKGRGGRAAGVGSRSVDAATKPDARGRGNSNLRGVIGGGIAPAPEAAPKDPPPGASLDDKIAFYEKRLEQALRVRDSRKKFADKLPDVKARIEASDNPEKGLQTFERRKKIVEENYEKAKRDVEEIENKLAELRG